MPTYQPGALRIEPVLHALDVPVRAMILPMLDLSIATQISAAVRQLLLPVLSEGSIWLQVPGGGDWGEGLLVAVPAKRVAELWP